MWDDPDAGGGEPNWEVIAREYVAAYLEEELEAYRTDVEDIIDDLRDGEEIHIEDIEYLWNSTSKRQRRISQAISRMTTDSNPDLASLPDRVLSMESRLHQALWQAMSTHRTLDQELVNDVANDTAAILLAIQSGEVPRERPDEYLEATASQTRGSILTEEEFLDLFDGDDDDDDDPDTATPTPD